MSRWHDLFRARPSSAARPCQPDEEADRSPRLDALLEEVGKLGREQFRATTLLEGHGAVLDELADAWREHAARHERESAEPRPTLAELEGRARLGLIKDLLPLADALEASLEAARALAAEPRATPTPAPAGSWLARLRGTPLPPAPRTAPRDAVEAWLDGLALVQRRLLALLEREDVQPIAALGRPFDPHRHLAVGVRPDRGVPDGTVVGEELRGYLLGERVLRHAQVVVARAGDDLSPPQPGGC